MQRLHLRSQRAGFRYVAQRLADLGALTGTVDDAVDVLWFHLGNAAYFTLTEDNGWSLDRAESWLFESLRRALQPYEPPAAWEPPWRRSQPLVQLRSPGADPAAAG